jgi:trans-aconitate methyltransferase
MWLREKVKRIKYYEETKQDPPSFLLLSALKYGSYKTALDIGCGTGADTKEMVKRGIKVTAIDVNKEVKNYFTAEDLRNINLLITPIEKFNFKKYDLIFAKSSLIFLQKKTFIEVLLKIKSALNTNGIFAARLWGVKDSYNVKGKRQKFSFVEKQELLNYFKGFKLLAYAEEEKDRVSAGGDLKHFHFINIILEK